MSHTQMHRVVEGLTILLKYETTMHYGGIAAEHDIIHATGVAPHMMTEADQNRLSDIGWHWDQDHEGWYKFT